MQPEYGHAMQHGVHAIALCGLVHPRLSKPKAENGHREGQQPPHTALNDNGTLQKDSYKAQVREPFIQETQTLIFISSIIITIIIITTTTTTDMKKNGSDCEGQEQMMVVYQLQIEGVHDHGCEKAGRYYKKHFFSVFECVCV
jgi:hypothetical protein